MLDSKGRRKIHTCMGMQVKIYIKNHKDMIKGSFVEKLYVAESELLCPNGMCPKRSLAHILTSPKISVSNGHLPEVESRYIE